MTVREVGGPFGHLPRVSPNSLEDLPRSTHRAARRARSFGWWGASSSHMRRRGMRPWLQCRERGPGPVPRPAKLVKAAGAGWSLCASTAPSTSMTSSLGPATWFQVSIIARMNSAVLKAISDLKESAWSPIHLRRQSGTKTCNCQNAIFADAEVTDGHPLGTPTVQIDQQRGASIGRPGLGTAFDANPMVYLPTGRPDMTPSPPMASSGVRRIPHRIARRTPSRRLGSIAVLSAVLAASSGRGHDSVSARHKTLCKAQVHPVHRKDAAALTHSDREDDIP